MVLCEFLKDISQYFDPRGQCIDQLFRVDPFLSVYTIPENTAAYRLDKVKVDGRGNKPKKSATTLILNQKLWQILRDKVSPKNADDIDKEKEETADDRQHNALRRKPGKKSAVDDGKDMAIPTGGKRVKFTAAKAMQQDKEGDHKTPDTPLKKKTIRYRLLSKRVGQNRWCLCRLKTKTCRKRIYH